MNSAPRLSSEDRPDFEAILDEALRSEAAKIALSGGGGPLNSEQLRTLALNAAEAISACAAPEYQQYLMVRRQIRDAADERLRPRSGGTGYAAAAGPVADPAAPGPGLFAIIAVLTPILAAAAAVIFLLLGYALGAGSPPPAVAEPLRTAGWLFAAVAAAGGVLGMAALLLTALRGGGSDPHERTQLPPEVTAARTAWLRALLERGLQPFLREALAEAATPPGAIPAESVDRDRRSTGSRMPRLGYSSPDFSSPAPEESPDPGRRFSSPGYSGPDFGGPNQGGSDYDSLGYDGTDGTSR
jgi:hypothetical protein